MLPLLPLLFLAVIAAPAGLLGKAWAPHSRPHEFLIFVGIVGVTSVIAVTPETISVVSQWIRTPINLMLLIDLSIYHAQVVAAASLFAGIGWSVAAGVQRLFED